MSALCHSIRVIKQDDGRDRQAQRFDQPAMVKEVNRFGQEAEGRRQQHTCRYLETARQVSAVMLHCITSILSKCPRLKVYKCFHPL
jgi:hypothetical protein